MKYRMLALAGLSVALGGTAWAQTAPTSPPVQIPQKQVAAAYLDRSTPAERQETRALNLLSASGYSDFHNLRRQGQDFAATVARNGATYDVTVDPETGQVRRQML